MLRKYYFCVIFVCLSLMFGIAPALADKIDISTISPEKKVEVGSWDALKKAVEDSANVGKVIVLTNNIEVDTNDPITSVGGSGMVLDGNGFTVSQKEEISNGLFINTSVSTDLIIQNITLSGFNKELSNAALGAVIYNKRPSSFNDISANFIDNQAYSVTSYAYGGAIYHDYTSSIQNISGDFSNNSAISENSQASGGAIHNIGNINTIDGNFYNNYVSSLGSSSSLWGNDTSFYAQGGAIYNQNQGSTTDKIAGVFSGNFAYSKGSIASGGAIHNLSSVEQIIATFSNNHVESDSQAAQGGAIFNTIHTINSISADFMNNYALSESYRAYGGAIYNDSKIKKISGSFSNNYVSGLHSYGGAIYNYTRNNIDEIISDFSGNYAKSSLNYSSGGAIYNSTYASINSITGNFSDNYTYGKHTNAGAIYNSGNIFSIEGNFSNNYTSSENGASAGAIYNDYTIGDLIANFSGNYALSSGGTASGGAIYNNASINTITGDFSDNYAKSYLNYAKGGAIYNYGTMTLINSSFYNNYVETEALKDSFEGQQTQGGAIYTTSKSNLTIKADGGDSIFSGNKVKWADGEDSSAIFLSSVLYNDLTTLLKLDARNSGLIRFNDKIVSQDYVTTYILQQINDSYDIKEDANGNLVIYYPPSGSIQNIIKKDGDVYWLSQSISRNIPQSMVDSSIQNYKDQDLTVIEEGNDFSVILQNGTKIEFLKQDDGTYYEIQYKPYSIYGANITVTGDSSGQVDFNNALEKIGKIDISGTNVDVNEGAGTIYRTITHDKGVTNIKAGARAEDNIINQGGTMNVANAAEISRTEINQGGTLNVATGGYAEDTTVNNGGKLNAETQARLNNLLANGGAILDIDSGAVLTGNIVMHADAQMGGTYDYSKIFKDEVTDDGSLTLIGGLNDVMTETSLVNNTEGKNLHLTAGNYVIGTNAQAVLGWDLLTLRDNATVKINGDIALSDAKDKILIEQNSTLDLAGNSPSDYKIVGSVSNDGDIIFTHSGDDADDITTIFGNYTAYNNATMTMDVNPSNNTSDLLRIEGDVSGTTQVDLNIVGASSDKPSQLIPFVEAPNDLSSTGAYFVINRVYNSAYVWKSLYKDGVWYTGTEDMILAGDNGYGNGDNGDLDEDAIAVEEVLPPNMADIPTIVIPEGDNVTIGSGNPSVVAEAIAYMGLPSVGIEQTRDMTRNVANKVASTKTYSAQCKGFYDNEYNGCSLKNAWFTPVYSYSDVKAPYSYEAEISGFEGGFDIQSDVYNRLGVYASYRQGNYEFDGDGEDYYSRVGSEIDIDSYILGLYHRYDEGRKWVMSQIFLGYQDVSMTTDDGISSETDGIEFGGSIEGGLIFNPMTNLTVEPIIRLAYTQINYDDASDRYRKTARYGDVRNIEVEAGVKVEKTYQRKNGYAKIYVKPSIIQNIGSGDVTVTSLRQVDGLENSTLGRIEVGGSMSFDEQWSGYANAAYTFGSDYNSASINAGLNYAF